MLNPDPVSVALLPAVSDKSIHVSFKRSGGPSLTLNRAVTPSGSVAEALSQLYERFVDQRLPPQPMNQKL